MRLPKTFEERIQAAGVLVLMGLLVELMTIFWLHPFSFMIFIAAGFTLTLAGIALYAYAAVHRT